MRRSLGLSKSTLAITLTLALTPVTALAGLPLPHGRPAPRTEPGRKSVERMPLPRGTHFETRVPGALAGAIDTDRVVDLWMHATPRSIQMAFSPVAVTDAALAGESAADAADADGAIGGPVGTGGVTATHDATAAPTLYHLTISGLTPGGTYYLYLDDFQNPEVIAADEAGSHAFDLDLPHPRLVMLQANPSTFHLHDDGTGCALIGNWDQSTLTCTLKRDVLQSIEIEDDGITLDGAGFTLDGTGPLFGSSGVFVRQRKNVTVRNVVIDGAATGVTVSGTSDSLFENITVRNGNGGFSELFETPGADTGRNTFRNNDVSVVCAPGDPGPCGFGLSSLYNNESKITGNDFSGANFGVTILFAVKAAISANTIVGCNTGVSVLSSLSPATIDGNDVEGGATGIVVTAAIGCTITGNHVEGATDAALKVGSATCQVSDNALASSALGLSVTGPSNTIFHNAFVANTQQALVGPNTSENQFNRESHIGGNFWSDFDEAGEGCLDDDADGFCDQPYALNVGADLLPWSVDGGWFDLTAPTTTLVLDGVLGGGGWYRSPIDATLTAEDNPGGVGVLRSEYGFDGALFTPAGLTVGLNDEGIASFYFRSIDRAGNAEAPQSVEVKIDLTPPSVGASQDPAANADGWNNGPVTVGFTCSDALSGIDSCPDAQIISGEGAGQVAGGTATDVAGNSAIGGHSVDIDLTDPVIGFAGGCDASAFLNHELLTDVAVTDALSGVASQSVPDGSHALDTTGVGAQSLEVTATDKAGNEASAACDYHVGYDFAGAGGFHAPVNNPPVLNIAKAGSTIPVKWQLPDGLGSFLSSLAIVTSVQAQQISCDALDDTLSDPIETVTSGASGLHFDPVEMQYIYNWKTSSLWSQKCFVLLLNLDDGSTYSAFVKFPK